jgi:4-aminobutyrate aminotransferase/(S)-3-amino-2-methylpropionate transaminase
MKVAPKGMDQCTTTLCGSSANGTFGLLLFSTVLRDIDTDVTENAFKLAFMAYKQRERGTTDPTTSEMDSSMLNQSPGSPALSVLSFKSGFHGRLFGSLSATRSKAIHKVDIPAFDWPCAPFPDRRYPLEENKEFNDKEEKRCLEEYEQILIESYVLLVGMTWKIELMK